MSGEKETSGKMRLLPGPCCLPSVVLKAVMYSIWCCSTGIPSTTGLALYTVSKDPEVGAHLSKGT